MSYLNHLQVINSMLMTLNSTYHSRLLTSHTILLALNKLYLMSTIGCHLIFSLNPSKTEFLVIGLTKQLEKLNHPAIHLPNNVILSPVHSARIADRSP